MSHKPKTRFVATVNGNDHELFSVRERGDRSLVLIINTARFLEQGDKLTEIQEQHYSIHKPKDGADTLITQKTLLAGNTTIANSTYIHDTADQLLHSVYARRLPIPAVDRPAFKAHPADTVIRVGSYQTATTTMLFTVFVSKGHDEFRVSKEPDMSVFTGQFSEFQIHVTVTYVNVPSHDSGDIAGLGSSHTVTNNVPGPDHVQLHLNSMGQDEAAFSNFLLMELLRKRLIHRVLSEITPEFPLETFLLRSTFFTRLPLIQHEQAGC